MISAKPLLTALSAISNAVTWFDGRPGFLDEQDLPTVTVYLSDARPRMKVLMKICGQPCCCIEVFLESHGYRQCSGFLDGGPHLSGNGYDAPELANLLELMAAQEGMTISAMKRRGVGSADLSYSISYIM